MEQGNDTESTSGRGGAAYTRGMRASDADREATATRLRQHYTEGRLDSQEYNERIDRCYAAKTVRELDELFIDLPRATTRGAEQERDRRDFLPPWRLTMILPVVLAFVVICALTGAHHFFWLLWPLLFFVFGPFGRWCGYRRWREDRPSSL